LIFHAVDIYIKMMENAALFYSFPPTKPIYIALKGGPFNGGARGARNRKQITFLFCKKQTRLCKAKLGTLVFKHDVDTKLFPR